MAARSVLPNNQTRGETTSDSLPGSPITVLDPANSASEAYRALRTSFLYAVVDTPPKVVVVTSPGPKEGKSTTCANLGVVLAQADKSVLIMDCDLRKPDMHEVFGLHNSRGVVNVLVGKHDLSEVWQEPIPGLKVVATGPLPPNPTELLSARRFAELVDEMREVFDYVLIDTPPTEVVSDPLILANQADGVLLVLDPQRTRKRSLRKSKRTLEALGANLLGTLINNVKDSNKQPLR